MFDPWIRLRVLGAAGSVSGLDFETVSELNPDDAAPAWHGWDATGSDGLRLSAGAGISLFWDLLRVDYVQGLDAGESQVLISFHPDFWDIS